MTSLLCLYLKRQKCQECFSFSPPSLVGRMQRMLFSRWVASGLVEGKSEQTGQQGNLRLQRVPTNVSVFSWAFCKPPPHTWGGSENCEIHAVGDGGRRESGYSKSKNSQTLSKLLNKSSYGDCINVATRGIHQASAHLDWELSLVSTTEMTVLFFVF